MGLSIGSLNFPGLCGPIVPANWELQMKLSKFFAVIGESVILGGVGGRPIAASFWMYDGYETALDLENAINQVNSHIGDTGTLAIDGAAARSWDKVLFLGFVPERDPLLDPQLGWIMIGNVLFRQLSPI